MLSEGDISALQSAYSGLYIKLNNAYWAASTMEAKDQIQGATDIVNKVLDTLDQAGLAADNAAIKSLTASLAASTKDLQDLQKQLDQIVHNVAIANDTIQAIDKSLTVSGKIASILA